VECVLQLMGTCAVVVCSQLRRVLGNQAGRVAETVESLLSTHGSSLAEMRWRCVWSLETRCNVRQARRGASGVRVEPRLVRER
jgi:hypothetical protein